MLANRVRELTSTTGTGDITLAGALPGHIGFSDAFTPGDSVIYVIEDGDNYEIGTGTLVDAMTLARTDVAETLVDGMYAQAGAVPINLSGNARVYCAATADFLLSPTHEADVIREVTPDAGVTADGVLLKDGGVFAGAGEFTGDLTAGGQVRLSATASGFPPLASGETAIYSSADLGAVIGGSGTSYDAYIANNSGAGVMKVPSGTLDVEFSGAATVASYLTVVGTATFESPLFGQADASVGYRSDGQESVLNIGKQAGNNGGQSTLTFFAHDGTAGNGFRLRYVKNLVDDELRFIDGGDNSLLTLQNIGNKALFAGNVEIVDRVRVESLSGSDAVLDLTARTSDGLAYRNVEIRSLTGASGNGGVLAAYTDDASGALQEVWRSNGADLSTVFGGDVTVKNDKAVLTLYSTGINQSPTLQFKEDTGVIRWSMRSNETNGDFDILKSDGAVVASFEDGSKTATLAGSIVSRGSSFIGGVTEGIAQGFAMNLNGWDGLAVVPNAIVGLGVAGGGLRFDVGGSQGEMLLETGKATFAGSVGVNVAPETKLHARLSGVTRAWAPYAGTVATFESNESAGCILQLIGSNLTPTGIWFGDNDARNAGRIRYENDIDRLELWTAGAERVSIDSVGDVFFGNNLNLGNSKYIHSGDGVLYIQAASGNLQSGLNMVPKGTSTASRLRIYGQDDLGLGTRLDIEQNGSSTSFINQSLGAGSNGSIKFKHDGTATLELLNDYSAVFAGAGSFAGPLNISEFLQHDGDTDTRLWFLPNRLILEAGGLRFFDAQSGGLNIDNPGLGVSFGGSGTFAGKLTVDGGAKISVQNKVDGGSGQGLFLWDTDDSNWGVYVSQAGALKSLEDGTACSSLDGRTAYSIRNRIFEGSNNAFIWENGAESCLMSLSADTGDLYTKGNLTSFGRLAVGGTTLQGGAIATFNATAALNSVTIDQAEAGAGPTLYLRNAVDTSKAVLRYTNNGLDFWNASSVKTAGLGSDGSLDLGTNADAGLVLNFHANRSLADATIANIAGNWDGDDVAQIRFLTGDDIVNKDNGKIQLLTAASAAGGPLVAVTINPDQSSVFSGAIYNTTSGARDDLGNKVAFASSARIIGALNPWFELWHAGASVGRMSYTSSGGFSFDTHTGDGSLSTILTLDRLTKAATHYGQVTIEQPVATMLSFDRTADLNVDSLFNIFVSYDTGPTDDFMSFGTGSNALRVYGDNTVKAMSGLEVTGEIIASSYIKGMADITANRPPAATAGAGASMFDTTLGKPIWSDGSQWVDATGTAV